MTRHAEYLDFLESIPMPRHATKWNEFLRRIIVRYERGELEYGDRSYSKLRLDLWQDVSEELEDVANYLWFLRAQGVRGMRLGVLVVYAFWRLIPR